MNLTDKLSVMGQWAIILTMFVGRVGILTLGMALWARQQQKALIKYPEESLMVG
jgi:trk system potassium uptake protein TrkH